MTTKSIADSFRPVIHREDGVYRAEVPAMPGCITVADTVGELKENLVEAMQRWLQTQSDLVKSRVD